MINLSYNLSEKISENLLKINELRTKILLTPIKPSNEIKLRWESNINKAYWGLTLAGNKLSKNQMLKLMSNPLPKKLSDSEKEVISYTNTLRVIYEDWSASKTAFNTKTVLDMYDLSCKPVFGSSSSYYKSKEEEVAQILKFIESGKDHPVIKSGLLQIEIIKLSPFENGTGRVARLLSHQMLSRYGYDVRGLLTLEEYYRSDLVSLREATKSIEKYKNATKWLEYFTEGVKKELEKLLRTVESLEHSQTKSNWKLSDRQKKIIELFENPEIKITNKLIQKEFRISQITASRDLSKMVNLGILLPHGKGRSVFYTK